MTKRPLSISIIGWLFIAVGCITFPFGVVRFLQDIHTQDPAASRPHLVNDFILASISRFLAILGGICTLRGYKWSRWLLLAWMGFHVIISIWHSPMQLVVHAVMFIVLVYFLCFRTSASEYFRGVTPERPQQPINDDTGPA